MTESKTAEFPAWEKVRAFIVEECDAGLCEHCCASPGYEECGACGGTGLSPQTLAMLREWEAEVAQAPNMDGISKGLERAAEICDRAEDDCTRIIRQLDAGEARIQMRARREAVCQLADTIRDESRRLAPGRDRIAWSHNAPQREGIYEIRRLGSGVLPRTVTVRKTRTGFFVDESNGDRSEIHAYIGTYEWRVPIDKGSG